MSPTGQYVHSDGGNDTLVHEHGYGLGPPTGVLVLRHLGTEHPVEFSESRDDHRHQLFWSDATALAVRRGSRTAHLGPRQAFWVRRGTTVEVMACTPGTVHVICLRQPPPALSSAPAATVRMPEEAQALVHALCRESTTEEDGLAARDRLLALLSDPLPLDSSGEGNGLARAVARQLLRDPADTTELREWAERLHTTTKTLQRDFVREFDVSWTTWRSRTRLQAATALLESHSVTEVAHRVGFVSVSAFVQSFRRQYGTTPAAWAREGRLL